jgi:hypothetical protein
VAFRIKTDTKTEQVLISAALFGDALHRRNFTALFNYYVNKLFLTSKQENSPNYQLSYNYRFHVTEIGFNELDELFLLSIPDSPVPLKYTLYQPGMLLSAAQAGHLSKSLLAMSRFAVGDLWTPIQPLLIPEDKLDTTAIALIAGHIRGWITGMPLGYFGLVHHLVPDMARIAYDMHRMLAAQLCSKGVYLEPEMHTVYYDYDYENSRLFDGLYYEPLVCHLEAPDFSPEPAQIQ